MSSDVYSFGFMIENVCIHLTEQNVGFTVLAEKNSEQDSRTRVWLT